MSIFNLEVIGKSYFEEEEFIYANELCSKMSMTFVDSKQDMMTDNITVIGIIKDGEIEHNTTITFGWIKNKKQAILIGNRTCDCETFKKKNCAHMAAMIIYLNNFSVEDILDGSPKILKTSKEIITTEQQFIRNFAIEYANKEQINFQIVLYLINNDIKMGVNIIKGKRKIRIKNIFEFAKRFETEEEFIYAKDFSFIHNINNIKSSDQFNVSLLISLINSKEPTKDSKYILLNELEIALLIDYNVGKKFLLMYNNNEMEVVCDKPEIPFSAKIVKEEEMYIISCILIAERAWFVNTGVFYLSHGKIAFYKAKNRPIYEFMRLLFSKSLKIMNENFFSFYDNVITTVNKLVKVETNFDVNELYIDLYKFVLYIDAQNKNVIEVGIKLQHGEKEVDFKDVKNEAFSKSNYLKIVKTLESYGQEIDDKFIITNNEVIYEFVTIGLNILQEFVEKIKVTEKFKKFKVIKEEKIKLNAKMTNKLLNLDVDIAGINNKELSKILGAYHKKETFYRLDNGDFVDLSSDFVEELNTIVDDLKINKKELAQDGTIVLKNYDSIYLNYLDEEHNNVILGKDKNFDEFLLKLSNITSMEFQQPKELKATLKPYQIEGVKFLKTMYCLGLGAILADDMGLGKTIQVITLILDSYNNKPSLIVCPSSLILNWVKEFSKFSPNLKILTISEQSEIRKVQIENEITNQIVVTSYELLRRDVDYYKDLNFQFLILDESHYIKNNNTKNFKTVKQITSDMNIALTGTPIENNLSELWSLFDFIVPGYLGTNSYFVSNYESKIIKYEDNKALNRLKALVKPFILRRLKVNVLDELPEKNEEFVYIEMDEKQKDIYNANFIEMKKKLEDVSSDQMNKNKFIVLSMLTKLRQLSCHPGLIYEDYDQTSNKLEKAITIIKDSIKNKKKTLLFSQYTSMLELIEERLNEEGINFYILRGSTKKTERHQMTEDFNTNDVDVFLISLKSGGTGLNLVGANTVIHFDPWWNMSVQNQATDRVYRIGQTKDVVVYKLISNGTIEEKIVELQSRKLKLIDETLSNTEDSIMNMTQDDILSLFD